MRVSIFVILIFFSSTVDFCLSSFFSSSHTHAHYLTFLYTRSLTKRCIHTLSFSRSPSISPTLSHKRNTNICPFFLSHRNLNSQAFNYLTVWDAEKINGCVCDSTRQNYDCSLFVCPNGDDPLTTGQVSE